MCYTLEFGSAGLSFITICDPPSTKPSCRQSPIVDIRVNEDSKPLSRGQNQPRQCWLFYTLRPYGRSMLPDQSREGD